MPYVPSKKTDGKSTDREILNVVIEGLALKLADQISNNLSLVKFYIRSFLKTARLLRRLLRGWPILFTESPEAKLAIAIYKTSKLYGYEGAYLGELNYPIFRILQRVPQILVMRGVWKNELRYWLYACGVEALFAVALKTAKWGVGIGGVMIDIKDEYKRRINLPYEAEQIIRHGDCVDAVYYTRIAEVVDESGNKIGYQEVMLKKSDDTLFKDVLGYQIVVRKKSG